MANPTFKITMENGGVIEGELYPEKAPQSVANFVELCGTEVKSIRQGTLNLKDAWCGIKNGELLLNQMHISPYDHGNRFNVDSRRPRRLLMHRREIMRLYGKVKQDGYSLIPLSVYLKGSRVKVKIGLCKGKKLYDKREAAAVADAKRQIQRAMKERY